jgi:type I restriction enzyme, S subunit
MSEWRAAELGDVADIKGGKRLPKGSALIDTPTNHPYIRTRDINGNKIAIEDLLFVPNEIFPSISNYIVEKGDVIISIVGTIGLCALIPDELHLASLTENCAKIVNIDSNLLNKTFLFYYLVSPDGQAEIRARNVGSTQPKLPLYNIKSLPISLPPLPEQKAITAVLSALDDKIDLLHRQNKTLESMAQALFRHWFIDNAADDWEECCLGDVAENVRNSAKHNHVPSGTIWLFWISGG